MTSSAAADSWWRQRFLLLAGGAALLAAGTATWWRLAPSSQSLLFWLCWSAAGVGVFTLVAALMLRPGRVLKVLQVAAGNAVILALLVAGVEVAGRAFHLDFDALAHRGRSNPRAEYPLCFREPDAPLGDVYFKRAGPLEWTGRPLAKILELRHGTDNAYRDEPTMTLRYDDQGFRNSPGLKDWDVAVVGDSFTETGYLPAEKIYTSIAAVQSGLRIKNLGICNTGPFTHLEYLKQFAGSPSCKIAVLAFFEGNDITDAEQEDQDLQRYRTTGARPSRQIEPQTSFVKAVYQTVNSRVRFPQERRYENAMLTAGGKAQPITLQPLPMPPDPAAMTEQRKALIRRFLDDWRTEVEKAGMKPWVLYLPINNRTYHGLYRGEENLPDELKNWRPNQLPEFMRSECEQRDFHFLDATPVLRAAVEKGTLVYNPIFDTHLNEEGSRLVGELLAFSLKEATPAPAPP